jgi:hypothetical protein
MRNRNNTAGIFALAKFIASTVYAGKNARVRDLAMNRYWQRLRRALEDGELTTQPESVSSVDLDELVDRFDRVWPETPPRADWTTEGLDAGWHEWKRGGRFMLTAQAIADPVGYAKWVNRVANRQQFDERGLILKAIQKYQEMLGYTKERNGS